MLDVIPVHIIGRIRLQKYSMAEGSEHETIDIIANIVELVKCIPTTPANRNTLCESFKHFLSLCLSWGWSQNQPRQTYLDESVFAFILNRKSGKFQLLRDKQAFITMYGISC